MESSDIRSMKALQIPIRAYYTILKIGILPPFTIYVYCDYQLITDCFLFGSIFGRNAVTIPNNGNSVLT